MEAKWIFRPLKLHRKKYVETTWIFRPSKLHREKHVGTTWIFRSAKLHRKCTWKWRANSSKFSLQRIHVISTSARWVYIWVFIYYMQSWKQCALPVIQSPQWLCYNSYTWGHDVRLACAQVHELSQTHCGDNREDTYCFMIPNILHPSCFMWDLRFEYSVSCITYDQFYIYIIYIYIKYIYCKSGHKWSIYIVFTHICKLLMLT